MMTHRAARPVQSRGIRPLSLRWKILIGFGLLLSASLTLVVAAVTFGIPFTQYTGYYGRERAHIRSHLNSVADLKKERLLLWLKERKEDAATISDNLTEEATALRQLHEVLRKAMADRKSGDQLRSALLEEESSSVVTRQLKVLVGVHRAFKRIQIADSESRFILASTEQKDVGIRLPPNRLPGEASESADGARLDFVKLRPSGKTHLVMSRFIGNRSAPMDSTGPGNSVLLLYVDTELFIKPLLYTDEGLGVSGEIVLVNEHAKILLPLKYPLPDVTVPKTFEYQIKAGSALLASQGQEGIVSDKDYRGVPVLAAYRHIVTGPHISWGLVVKCDRSECLAPLRRAVFSSALIGAITLVGVGFLAALHAKRISRPIENLTRTAQEVKGGNLDIRANAGGSDELGMLTATFNSMIEGIENWHGELEEQVKVRTARLHELNAELTREVERRTRVEESLKKANRRLRTLSDCNQAMVRATKESTLLDRICRLIGEVGGHPATWVKIAPRDESATDRSVACWGVEERDVAKLTETLANYERSYGPTGTAIRTGEICIIRNILSDPIAALWREELERSNIKSLVSFPLRIEKDVVGAITIAAEESDALDEEELVILEELAGDLAYGIEMLRTRASWRETEKALRESEQRFRAVFENEHVIMLIVDPETGGIEDGSPGACAFYGYDRPTLKKLKITDLSTMTSEKTFERIRPAMSLMEKCLGARHRLSRGEERDVEVCSGPIVVGETTYLLSVVNDVTDRIRAGEAAFKADQEWQETFDAISDLVMVLDNQYRIHRANKAMVKALGLKEEEVIGRRCFELVHGTELPPDSCPYLLLIADGKEHAAEIMEPRLGGTYEVRISPLAAKDGTSDRSIHIIRDITARKKAEEDLERSRKSFTDIVEKNRDGILVLDADNSILYANAAAEAFLGEKVSELVGTDFSRSVVLEDKTHLYVPRPDGDPLVAEIAIGSVDWHGTPAQVVMLHYITDRILVEKTLKTSEERMRQLIEASPMGIRIVRNGKTLYVNPAFLEMFGYESREEVIGLSEEALCRSGDAQLVKKYEEEFRKGTRLTQYKEFKALKKTGETFEVGKWITSMEFQGKPAALVFVADISREKTLKFQLLQAQKMEAIGTLAGGIAHDFNNILTIISGFTELLLAEKVETDDDYVDLQKIFRASQNGAELVRQLLTFSRKVETKLRPIGLNLQVKNVEKLLSRTIPKTIQVELHLAEDLNMVNADPSQIEQVLVNLAVNAKQAMVEGGKLVFETRNASVTAEHAKEHLGMEPGEYVMLLISDTGHGMAKDVLERVFEPFFTTKKPGEGTGLGLSMVYGIVKGHGGYITCYSEVGVGTIFKIYVPVFRDGEVSVGEKARKEPEGGTETILLVDDEEPVRDLGGKLLSHVGYRVLTACNGVEALQVYRENREEIALVILDLIMPEMDGKHCFRELLRINPDVKVLISSGYSSRGPVDEVIRNGARGFVEKPYKVNDLLRSIRTILDQE